MAPRSTARLAAASMPYPTASPCRKRRYFVTASSAWPSVCPKFSARRGPDSRSSCSTTWPLMRQHSAITGTSTDGSRAKSGERCALTWSKSGRLAMTPYLTTSYRPARNSRRGSVARSCGVDDDRGRLVIGADQVLARGVVDADLAADRAVDLRQERRRHLDDRDAAEVGRGGESGDVADDPAADGDDRRRAIGRGANQGIVDASDGGELLVALAVGNEDRLFRGEPRERVAVQAPHGGIRHDEAPARRTEGVDDAGETAGDADLDLDGIGARRCADLQRRVPRTCRPWDRRKGSRRWRPAGRARVEW